MSRLFETHPEKLAESPPSPVLISPNFRSNIAGFCWASRTRRFFLLSNNSLFRTHRFPRSCWNRAAFLLLFICAENFGDVWAMPRRSHRSIGL